MKRGKKKFINTGISTRDPRSSSEESPQREAHAVAPRETRVAFTGRTKFFDFKRWYGGGVDQITAACQAQILRFLGGHDAEVTQVSIVTYCQVGLRPFLEYALLRSSALERELSLADINRDFIDGFLTSCDGSGVEVTTQKSRYSAAKSVLKALSNRGLITEIVGGDEATFPKNPFPGVHRHGRANKPLTVHERKAFSSAVKKAVIPIFSDGKEHTSNLLAYALLIIALHTGRNTTPLLEMKKDCLRPHPKTGVQFLVVFKRRGYAESKVALRDGRAVEGEIESLTTLRPTVTDLVRRVIALAERLRPEAPEEIEDSIWLYRMRSPGRGTGFIGAVSALKDNMLAKAISDLVKEYSLVDADGKPLRINVSRLRKSFINRVYEILDGDVAATAAAAGNTVAVVDTHYLKPGEHATKNWMFMGRALTEELINGALGSTERTPVARCSDVRKGEFAPKKAGLVCTSFLNCLRCRNLVVTADDLYRLFSFYWRVLKERANMHPKRWKKQMAHIVRLIDRDVIEAGLDKGIFKRAAVERERARAFSNPHPFWRTDVALAELGDLGIL